MPDRLLDSSLHEFADHLAAVRPTPGGGSAAAYAGAMGASLAAMAARIAIQRTKDERPDIAELVEEADSLRARFLRLVEDDSAAFDRVAKAMKLPKSSEAQQAARAAALQDALLAASRVPLEAAKEARRLLNLCGRAAQLSTSSAVSDAGVAALLAETALRGAALNVMINLASLKDAGQVKALSEELDQAVEGAEALRRDVIERVEARIAR